MIVNSSTPLIRPYDRDGNLVMQWPVYLIDVRREWPNVSFSTEQNEENLYDFGYWPLLPGTRPTGDVVTETTPILVDGKWVQQYEVRAYNPDEIQQQFQDAMAVAYARLDGLLENTYGLGFSYTKSEGVVHQFSLTSDNQQLMTGLHLLAKQSDGTRVFKLRTLSNITVDYTAEEVIALTTALMEYVVKVLEKLWELMDDISVATQVSEIPEIPDVITTDFLERTAA
ncbi:hypothetical protein [Erwinia phage vB_Ea277G]|jgi:hypothetical protein|nr:hypothetical protein [Erwinia phage vB_Ea277G]